jgi:hypothetical protein
MQTRIRSWLSSFILLLLPADGTEPDPTKPGETEPAPGEPAAEGGEPAAAAATEPEPEPEPDMVPRAELDRVKADHEARVREDAEALLMKVVPDQYPGRADQPYYGNQPPQPAAGEPEQTWEDMSDEERQNYLRAENQQLRDNQDRMTRQAGAERLIDDLEKLKSSHYPEMDVRECLGILTRRPDARIDKLAEISHLRAIDRQDIYVESRLKDPDFRTSHDLPPIDPNTQSGTPAQTPAEPGRVAATLPGSGPTTTSAEPVTTANARHVLRDRLRASGFETRS